VAIGVGPIVEFERVGRIHESLGARAALARDTSLLVLRDEPAVAAGDGDGVGLDVGGRPTPPIRVVSGEKPVHEVYAPTAKSENPTTPPIGVPNPATFRTTSAGHPGPINARSRWVGQRSVTSAPPRRAPAAGRAPGRAGLARTDVHRRIG